MKYLFLALCLLITTAHAPGAAAPRPATPVRYCLLYTLGYYFSKTSVRLDYGQNHRKELAVQDGALAVLAEEMEHFTWVPAALSYLDSKGWELVQAATLPEDKTAQVGYLLRRKP